MAEEFDMDIYNIALENGSYTEQNNVTNSVDTSNIIYVGDSAPNPNLVYLTESYHSGNIEYKQFSDTKDK
jgi:hypothetical protein